MHAKRGWRVQNPHADWACSALTLTLLLYVGHHVTGGGDAARVLTGIKRQRQRQRRQKDGRPWDQREHGFESLQLDLDSSVKIGPLMLAS